jgi:membrane-associated phospholipid phosphatase
VAAVAASMFAMFAHRYRGGSSARWLDNEVQAFVGPARPGRSLWDVVIGFGHAHSVLMLALLLGGVALVLGHRRIAILAIVGPGLTGVATTLLKPVVGRTMEGTFAYPSGHAGGATALGIVAALLLVAVLRTANGTSAVLLAGGTLLSGGTMALALVADEDHYPTDTFGGFCVAVAVVLACALAIERWAERTSR